MGLQELFAVERKSISDLVGCCMGENRARFERELHRLRGYRFKRLDPDVASQSVILVHTSVASKVGSYGWHQKYSISFEDWHPETSDWILENHPISRLINCQAKLRKQRVTEQAVFAWEDLLPMNARGDRVETLLPELHGSIDVTNRYA